MLKLFKNNETFRNIIINTAGNYLNIFFVALFAIVTVRLLEPAQYGVLSVLLGIAYVLANVLDLGTSALLYSKIPVIYSDKKRLRKFIKTTFFYQTSISLLIVLTLITTFEKLDQVFFKTGAPFLELSLTAFSILFFVWQNFLVNAFLAAKKVFESNLYLNISNLVKTLVLAIFIILGKISIASLIFIFSILGPFVFFLLVILKRKDAFKFTVQAPLEKEMLEFSYILTFFIASQFFSLATRTDLFLLSYYSTLIGKETVGYYGLAQKIIFTITASITSITQILSPKYAKAKTGKELKNVFKESFKYLLIPTFAYILVVFTPTFFYQLFFTEKFTESARIARLLSIGYLLFPLGNIPYLFFLYTEKKPRYILFANLILFTTVALVSYFGIPKYNIYAPVASIFVGTIIAVFFLSINMKKFLKKYKI